MADSFENIIGRVRAKFRELSASPKHLMSSLPKTLPEAGIYLFWEDDKPLYVGRTNNLRKRLRYHVRNSHNQATFAFLLARHQTASLKASYKSVGSRKDLLQNPEFRAAFDSARNRIAAMHVQFVEEQDPVRQAILEIFVAHQTGATFNDFRNH